MSIAYGFSKRLDLDFDSALHRVTAALKTEGFGVLTEIDVAATLHAKLAVQMPPYRILGACNPPLAHRALSAEPSIGLLLPCNVVVRQLSEREVLVEFMDPVAVMQLVGREDVEPLAREVRERLERVRDAL